MWCSSQNIYPKIVNDSLIVITPQQLKTTNLIFLEHKKFKLEFPELNKQISSYEKIIKSYVKTDSIKDNQIDSLMYYAKESNQFIQNQNIQINKLKSNNSLLFFNLFINSLIRLL